MIFNEQELNSLNQLSDKYPLVKKILDEYLDYQKDSSKLYFIALNDAAIDIAKQIKNKQLDMENTYTKSVLKLLETGDKVFNTLERGKQELNKVVGESVSAKKKNDKIAKEHEGKALI